MHQEEKVTF